MEWPVLYSRVSAEDHPIKCLSTRSKGYRATITSAAGIGRNRARIQISHRKGAESSRIVYQGRADCIAFSQPMVAKSLDQRL